MDLWYMPDPVSGMEDAVMSKTDANPVLRHLVPVT